MSSELYSLIPLFFIIATVYSSAGFGGGSSYLAVLSLFSIEFTAIRIIALLCNITVVSSSVYLFYQHDLIPMKRIWPLVILSVPLAFLGGTIQLDQSVFFILLGITLICAALFMIIKRDKSQRRLPQYTNGVIGGGIGFLSGLVGIGGGIFLSPVLYITRWHTAKAIAATTAFFILVNSIAGLIGQWVSGSFEIDWKFIIGLLIAVFLGSQLGSRLTIFRLNPIWVKRITAVLILIVGVRILIQWV